MDLSGNYVTTNTVFNLGPPYINGTDFKFVSHNIAVKRLRMRQHY